MKNWSLTGVDQGFKTTNLTAPEVSSIDTKKTGMPFRQFVGKFADIAVTIFLMAILISALLEPLYRDLLLSWLRDILETH